MGGSDVFVNAVGGVKVLETGVDLALLLAVVSVFVTVVCRVIWWCLVR